MRAAGVGLSEGNLKDYLEEVLLQYACNMGGVITETSVVQKISRHSSNYVVVVVSQSLKEPYWFLLLLLLFFF